MPELAMPLNVTLHRVGAPFGQHKVLQIILFGPRLELLLLTMPEEELLLEIELRELEELEDPLEQLPVRTIVYAPQSGSTAPVIVVVKAPLLGQQIVLLAGD